MRQWQDYQDDYETRGRRFSYNAQLIYTSQPGRPRFNVTAPQLQYLRSMSFTWVQIAEILGVSYMTVYRRRQELGISDTVGRTITDTELHQQAGAALTTRQTRHLPRAPKQEGPQDSANHNNFIM